MSQHDEKDDGHAPNGARARDGVPSPAGSDPATGPKETAAEPKKRGRGRPRKVAEPSDGPPVIKKYANRRLYDTASSRYVTLEDLAVMVREGTEFTVEDARDGTDITRSVLGQIIFEQEAKSGQSLLPTEFLRRIIALYGDGLGAVVPSYLEESMRAFARGQDEMREQLEKIAPNAFGPAAMLKLGTDPAKLAAAPLKLIEEQTRRNAEMFRDAMRMFSPFGGVPRHGGARDEAPAPDRAAGGEASDRRELDEMREQMRRMQERMDRLGK